MKSNFNQQFQQQVQRQQQQRQREMGYAWQQQQKKQKRKEEQLRLQHMQQADPPFMMQQNDPVIYESIPRKRRGFFYPFKWIGMFVIYMIMPGLFIVAGASILGTELWGYDDVFGLIVGFMFALVAAYWLTNKVLNQRA